MYSLPSLSLGLLGLLAAVLPLHATAQDAREALSQIGRPATAAEVAAWDIDVRPDFLGLPAGSGNALDGEELWIAQCSSCHGDFADSNEIFSPLALGNTTAEDMRTGHVAALTDPTAERTTLMKVATVSTLWDYINRAMPWNAPKSLASDEVYALVAYLLSLGYIIEDDFELSRENMAEVQARMPNRNGMSTEHGLWSVDGKPDVNGSRCKRNCAVTTAVQSSIPAFAMNAHGNLRDQMRTFGPYRGINTAGEEPVAATVPAPKTPEKLLQDGGCLACHQLAAKLVGPAFTEITAKYAGRDDAVAYLAGKILNGGSGVWGGVMPPMPQVGEENAAEIAAWLAGQ